MQRKWLYLPIEVKVRELHGKLLLAAEAARRGFNVVLGPKNDIHFGMSGGLPPGIMFNIGMDPGHAKLSATFKAQGHRVVVMDEEGLALYDDALYVRHRVCREASACTDLVLCWGRHQAGLVAGSTKESACVIHSTGNCRFDVLQAPLREIFQREAGALRGVHGRFILVNTNFPHSNHYNGSEGYFEGLKQRGLMDSPENERYFRARVSWKQRVCSAFMELVPRLAVAFPDHKVIVRPHPSENHGVWREVVAGCRNAAMIHEGDVVVWLLAAEALVHNGCTTAMEAYALDRPAVAYRPFIEPQMESELANRLSMQAGTEKEVVRGVRESLRGGAIRNHERTALLREHVINFEGPSAAETIVQLLLQPGVSPEGSGSSGLAAGVRIGGAMRRYSDRIRSWRAPISPHGNYAAQKCAPLSAAELRRLVAAFGEASGIAAEVQITPFGRQSCLLRGS